MRSTASPVSRPVKPSSDILGRTHLRHLALCKESAVLGVFEECLGDWLSRRIVIIDHHHHTPQHVELRTLEVVCVGDGDVGVVGVQEVRAVEGDIAWEVRALAVFVVLMPFADGILTLELDQEISRDLSQVVGRYLPCHNFSGGDALYATSCVSLSAPPTAYEDLARSDYTYRHHSCRHTKGHGSACDAYASVHSRPGIEICLGRSSWDADASSRLGRSSRLRERKDVRQ